MKKKSIKKVRFGIFLRYSSIRDIVMKEADNRSNKITGVRCIECHSENVHEYFLDEQEYKCYNCGKTFTYEDLIRRTQKLLKEKKQWNYS
jgi:transposase-like protein